MAAAIYTLCALTSLVCAVLLLRSYARSRMRLLLWSGLCFVGLTGNNAMLVVDRLVLPSVDLTTPRLALAFLALMLLVCGLIWEND
jgi:Family of unknown function (DUF5985)